MSRSLRASASPRAKQAKQTEQAKQKGRPEPPSSHHTAPALAHSAGVRRALVVSPTPFNTLTKTPVVVPVTSGGNFARNAGFAVSLMGAGTQTTGVVRCDQPRVLDLAARYGRKLESVPEEILNDVLARLVTLFE